MKYTFLLPAYKLTYIDRALNSIFSQTYSDFKVIISNDCSPYDIDGVVERYSRKYHNIEYIKNNKNIGGENLVNHWNYLVSICNSDYLIMASDDDVYNPLFLEKMDKLVNNYPDVNIIRARVQRINKEDVIISKEDIFEEYQSELETIHSVFCGNYIGCIGNYVFKTSALKNIGGFIYLPYAWFSDMLTAIAMSNNGQANTKEILFSFRLSNQNISDTIKNRYMDRKKLSATISFHKWMGQYMSKIDYQESLYNSNMYNEIISGYTHRAYSQSGDYSWSIPVYRWNKIYKKFSCQKFFSRGSFFKYFIIAVINRKLAFLR